MENSITTIIAEKTVITFKWIYQTYLYAFQNFSLLTTKDWIVLFLLTLVLLFTLNKAFSFLKFINRIFSGKGRVKQEHTPIKPKTPDYKNLIINELGFNPEELTNYNPGYSNMDYESVWAGFKNTRNTLYNSSSTYTGKKEKLQNIPEGKLLLAVRQILKQKSGGGTSYNAYPEIGIAGMVIAPTDTFGGKRADITIVKSRIIDNKLYETVVGVIEYHGTGHYKHDNFLEHLESDLVKKICLEWANIPQITITYKNLSMKESEVTVKRFKELLNLDFL